MARKITEIQQIELKHIKEWCLTIIEFMSSHYEEKQVFSQYSDIIINGYQKQNLRGLRSVYKDTNEWAKGIPHSDFIELNKLLQNRFGEDLIKNANRDLLKIEKVIKKGKIGSEGEYRLLLSRVDEIYNDESKQNEVQTLNKLLVGFHKK